MTETQEPYKVKINDWGRILVVTRLEKMVDAQFVQEWSHLITKGLRQTDGFIVVKDRVAHQAANDAIRVFLQTDFDTLFFVDSDWSGGPGYLEELRTLEDGFDYDIFQGFYTRRGWPPEAIWFKETALGGIVQAMVWKDDHTEETAMVGFHNALIRRQVFEDMLASRPGVDVSDFTWAYYPVDNWQSEDGVFCTHARDLGFKIGSTTKVKCGHISRVTVGWETYQEYLELSGAFDFWRNYYDLIELVADFTGESYDMVIAKAIEGHKYTKDHWDKTQPKTGDEIRGYYGDPDNGYLYDLLAWNTSPTYKKITDPLLRVNDKKVLIVGGGIGGEVEKLKEKNAVTVFELPGVLNEFLHHRYKNELEIDIGLGQSLTDWVSHNCGLVKPPKFDLIVAVDVIEHIPPDELDTTLRSMLGVLGNNGKLYLHNNFGAQDLAPQHFDHKVKFDQWITDNKLEKISEFEYQRKKQ